MPSAPRATPPGAPRRDRREQARALRREREATEARAARVRAAWRDLARVALAALAVVAVLVVIGEATREDRSSGSTATTARQTVDRFTGIRQSGYALGSPNAPVTVVEFADMQCPFCAEFDREVLPTVLQRYVRTGKVRVELRTMAFLGED